MNKNFISLKTITIVVWGILICVILFNQRLDLNYLQKERWFALDAADYTFSEIGKEKENLQKYRVDKGSGTSLVGFSDPDDFLSVVRFNFQAPQTIRLKTDFQLTANCKLDSIPKEMKLVLERNGALTDLPISKNTPNELRLNVSDADPVMIHAQAGQQNNTCGAVNVSMSRMETASWPQVLALWAFWLTAISIMLINGNYFLPIFSLIIIRTFQKAELLYTSILSWEQLLFFSAISIGLVTTYSLLTSLGFQKIWVRFLSAIGIVLLLVISLFIPATVLGFNVMFEGPMSKYDWFAILQTDLGEVIEFINVFAPKSLIVQATAIIVLVVLMIFFSGRKRSRSKFTQWFVVAVSAVVIFIYISSSNVVVNSYAAMSEYYHDLSLLEEQIGVRKDIVEKINAQKPSSDEIYVVIVGESANRNHFSLYGYPRSTTPRLDTRLQNNDLIRFDQSYSCGVSTRGALQYALTQATLEKGSPSESPSIMEVLNAANFETHWIHNGSTSIGHNLLKVIGEQADFTDHLSSIYGVEDGKLIAEVEKIVSKKSTSNKVIFLKTQGSHVKYCERLPEGKEWTFEDKDFDRWLIPEKYELTKISEASNCYDGTVKYTDYFIDEIITRIQNTGKAGAVIYFSDHGEEIVEGTAHMGKKPTYGVFAVPMTIWFSDNYKNKYSEKYNNTIHNAKNVFINDSIFDSVLGLFDVEFDGLDKNNDVSSSQFKSGKYVYRGKKTVHDADNYLFHTYQNLQELKDKNLPFDVFLGPIEHPFHLAWLTGEYQYPNLSLSSTYDDGEYILALSSSKRKPISLKTVFKYLKPQPSQTFFIQIDLPQGADIDGEKAADDFISFLENQSLDSAQIIVTSAHTPYLDALSKRGIIVSYLLSDGDNLSDQYAYETITTNVNEGLSPSHYHPNNSVNLKVSSCTIDNCQDRVFETINELSDKMKIERVIIPMFSL